jgi:hypothetical protein
MDDVDRAADLKLIEIPDLGGAVDRQLAPVAACRVGDRSSRSTASTVAHAPGFLTTIPPELSRGPPLSCAAVAGSAAGDVGDAWA